MYMTNILIYIKYRAYTEIADEEKNLSEMRLELMKRIANMRERTEIF